MNHSTGKPRDDLPTHRGEIWRRAAVMALLCVALAAAASSDMLHEALLEVLQASEMVIADNLVAGTLLFVVFAAISAMFAFVSIAVIVPVAVYTWGEPISMLLLWLGWILGGICAYSIARFLGRPVVGWLTSAAALNRLEHRVQHNAPFGLVLLFQLALPSEIPGYVLGLVRYSFPRYLLALGLAELPYTVATVYLGAGFVERRSMMVLMVGAVLVAFSVGAFYVLRSRMSSLSE